METEVWKRKKINDYSLILSAKVASFLVDVIQQVNMFSTCKRKYVYDLLAI